MLRLKKLVTEAKEGLFQLRREKGKGDVPGRQRRGRGKAGLCSHKGEHLNCHSLKIYPGKSYTVLSTVFYWLLRKRTAKEFELYVKGKGHPKSPGSFKYNSSVRGASQLINMVNHTDNYFCHKI